MKILIIGARGTIGSAVKNEFSTDHEIITAGRYNAHVFVDITSEESIISMYKSVGKVDAVISAAGDAYFGPLSLMTPESNEMGIQSKLKGQVNLVLLGLNHVNDGGSFTLTTGIIMDDPIIGGVSAAMASGGIKAFVRAASIEMPRGIRINNVSPTILEESLERYGPFFPGFEPVPANRVAKAYRKSVEGAQTGQTYQVY